MVFDQKVSGQRVSRHKATILATKDITVKTTSNWTIESKIFRIKTCVYAYRILHFSYIRLFVTIYNSYEACYQIRQLLGLSVRKEEQPPEYFHSILK